jgi:hypothetical protein
MDTQNHLENKAEPHIRVVLYVTDTMSHENDRMQQLLEIERDKAFERNEPSSIGNITAVKLYLAKEALSWHAGRDIAALEEMELPDA